MSPLVGKSEHHVKTSKHFALIIKDKKVEQYIILVSYDVSVLFSSVSVYNALTVIYKEVSGRSHV